MNIDYIYNNIVDELRNIKKSNNKSVLAAYYKVGKYITSGIVKYGDDIILTFADRLMNELDSKYTEANLRKYRYFYLLIENGGRLSFDLKWSHYNELLHHSVKKANYYIYLVEHNNLSIRELRTRIKNNEYEKLIRGTLDNLNNGIKISNDTSLKDFVKNPVIIRYSLNNEMLPEDDLQNLLFEDLRVFNDKLNTTFSFIGMEYKVKFKNNYHFIDILLFSVKFNCYIVVELKSGSFSSDHIFQLENYIDYVDDNIKLISENKTVGVVVVRKDNSDYIAYCTDNRILIRDDNKI